MLGNFTSLEISVWVLGGSRLVPVQRGRRRKLEETSRAIKACQSCREKARKRLFVSREDDSCQVMFSMAGAPKTRCYILPFGTLLI